MAIGGATGARFTASTKAVLSPPALSRPWKAMVWMPAVRLNVEVL